MIEYLYIIIAVAITSLVTYVCCQYYFKKRFTTRHNATDRDCAGFAELFNGSIFIIDHQYNIIEVYDKTTEILSRCVVGFNLSNLFAGVNYDQFVSKINAAISSKLIQEADLTVVESNMSHLYNVRFALDGPSRIICVLTNIDTQHYYESLAKQNELILSNVLDHMPFPVMIKDIDDDLKYIYWNNQCDILPGFHRDQVIGKTDFEIYGEERGAEFREIDLSLIASAEPYSQQEIFVTPDGVCHDTMVTKNVISNYYNNWLLVTRWDITDLIQVQKSLKVANSQLYLAFSAGNITPWMWKLDTNSVNIGMQDFKVVNDGFVMNRDEVTMDFVIENVHPDDREAIMKVMSQLISGEIKKVNLPVRYDINKKFNNIYNIYAAVESYDDNGVPTKIVGSLQNITEQKQFENELLIANNKIAKINRDNEIILNNTDIGLVYLTSDYMVQWENVSKYSEHPVAANYQKGIKCYENIKQLDSPCPGCIMQKAMKSKKQEIKEVEFNHNTIAQIVASPVFDDSEDCLGVVLKIKDITADRHRETDLRNAKESAEKSDKLKSAFLANMSHEIRTPLNAILGFSELLCTAEDEQEKLDYLQVINSNNELLLQLINDILDLSKIEADTLEFVFTDVDVNGVLYDLERSFSFKIDRPDSMKIVFEKPLIDSVIYTDRNRLQQVVSNFITNALKFTDKGSISFGGERRGGDVYFYVRDTGVGIPRDKLSEIFERFTKLDNFKTGTGLGLTICQTIVRKFGGKIGVESEVGVGSTFWFTIPYSVLSSGITSPLEAANQTQPNDEKLLSVADEEIKSRERATLLIAEDVVDNYKLYEVILGKRYNLVHAWNGREAVELFGQCHPDAILMDIKMPEMDGYQATEAIRKLDSKIPIIAVTAFVFSEDRKRITERYFTDFVAKPIHRQDLIDVLAKINL